MVPAALNQGLCKNFSFVIIAVKVQIRWWTELADVSASGQCAVPQLIQLICCQRAYAIEEAAELEDGQIWVWGRRV